MTTEDKNSHGEKMLQWFDYDHLPEHLQAVSQPFKYLATIICELKPGDERSTALRKLLEAKDAAVRAAVRPGQ